MTNPQLNILNAVNEDVRMYGKGSVNKNSLKEKIHELENKVVDIPLIINGKEVRTERIRNCVKPHDHKHILATYCYICSL